MFGNWRRRLRGNWLDRAIVIAALVAAASNLGVRLVQGAKFFGAFTQAAGIAFALMVVLATARELWRNDRLDEATGPGGWGLKFGRRAVGAVERRLDAHVKATDARLLDLERAVFKDREEDAGNGGERVEGG